VTPIKAQIAEGSLDRDDSHAADQRVASWRTVAERCIYGVDKNPLAVELAKVSLWLTTLAYDRPLSFFDHHLRCGDSLLGAPLRNDQNEVTAERIRVIPKEALADVDKEATPAEKALLRRARDRNAAELRAIERGQLGLFSLDLREPLREYARARAQLSLDDPTQSARDAAARNRWKERQLQDLTMNPRSRFYRIKQICNLWMAPWFWPHDAGIEPPSTDELAAVARELWVNAAPQSERAAALLQVSDRVASSHRFFHWELEFPEVFERGGFSAFVGNPPWETLGTESKEFFSNYDPTFRTYGKQEALRRACALRKTPAVDRAFRAYDRKQRQLSWFLRKSGVYTWFAGAGDLDIYRCFVERDFRALKANGVLAQVLPSSFYANSSASEVRRRLVTEGAVRRLIVNENRKSIFPIDSRIKIILLTVERGATRDDVSTAFFVGKDAEHRERSLSLRELTAILAEPDRHMVPISIDFIKRLAPATFSFLEIVDRKDAELLEHLSRHGIPFGSAWEPQYCRELDASNDSDLFRDADWLVKHGCRRVGWNWMHPTLGEFWPLVEGRNIYQCEFPVGEFDKWVNADEGMARLPIARDGKPVNLHPRLAWRDVASNTNERTVIAAIVPPKTFCKHKAPTIQGGYLSEPVLRNAAALFNSFVFDWQARVRGALALTYTLLSQLFAPCRIDDLALTRKSRSCQEAAVLAAYEIPFELAEHIFTQFPLLDRLMPALPGEKRSTVTRDVVLAEYAELRKHPKAAYYRSRVSAAVALGAMPFVPETRGTANEDDDRNAGEEEVNATLRSRC
jgi:hypothetical protein